MQKFIRDALMIRTGDRANIVVKLASDINHQKHLVGYVQKEKGASTYILMSKGYTPEELKAARDAYQTRRKAHRLTFS